MQTLTQIRNMLASRGLSPQKRFGQNFLIDHNLIRRLVDESGVGPGDVVLEVGPGTGTLTEALLERGAHVIAGEIDRGLCDLLRERLGSNARFTLIEGDCLASKDALAPDIAGALAGRPFRLVSNLPYGAATPLMMTLLISHPECGSMWVTIQREVGQRLAAQPGTRDYGPLAIVASALATVRTVATLPPECFWPRPEVTSVMVAIERLATAQTDDPAALAAFAQRLFGQRRKQIGSVLAKDTPWPEGISPTMRAEDLPLADILRLSAVATFR